MEILRKAAFGSLFAVTFVVAATFQLAMALLATLLAVLAPQFFNMNGVPAANAGQALGVLLFMVVIFLIINATISACGAALWIAVRKVALKSPALPAS